MTRNIDELSNLTTQKAEPPKEYFGKMDLNEEQVEKRLQYTEKANGLFDVILILLLTMIERGETNFFYAKSLLESWILSLVAEFTTPDDYLMDYATETAYNFVDTTNKHIDEPWYTSSDRALYNAENGANDVLNYTEYKEAIEAGKTEKRWITEKDNRVRKSHKAVTQKPIPILEYFRVGMAQMRFPKDYELAAAFPEELINSRCTIEYLPKDNNDTESEESWKKPNKADMDDNVAVSWDMYSEDILREKISSIEPKESVAKSITKRANQILEHRDKTHFEDLAYVDYRNGSNKINTTYDYYQLEPDGWTSRCKPSNKMEEMRLATPDYSIIGIHNHPEDTAPSYADIFKAYERKYKYGLTLGHKGSIFKYTLSKDIRLNEKFVQISVKNRLEKYKNNIYNNVEEAEKARKELMKYGVTIEAF